MNSTAVVSKEDLEMWLVLAKEAAYAAGTFLLDNMKMVQPVLVEDGRDIKLLADHRAEKIILDILKAEADIPILTEESGYISECNSQNSVLRWIVDPLDGTLNYQRTISLCCVSIGLWQGEKPLLGVVYDFNRQELFAGIVGIGATLNDKPIQVSQVNELSKAIICTGFPVNTDFSESALGGFVKSIQGYKKVRLLGSASLSLASLALGRVDAYYENNIMIWDVAAGVALVSAAGGGVVFKPGCLQYGYAVQANNGKLPFLECGLRKERKG